MTLEGIERLIRMAERHRLAEMHVSDGATTLSLKAHAGPVNAARVPDSLDSMEPGLIKALHVGLVRFTHPGASESLATAGMSVEAGAIVALLQVGPCLRPVIAPQAGVIGRPLVREGDLAGYGTPVFDYADA